MWSSHPCVANSSQGRQVGCPPPRPEVFGLGLDVLVPGLVGGVDLPNQNNFYRLGVKTFGTTRDSKEISGSVQTSNRRRQRNHNQKRLIVNF